MIVQKKTDATKEVSKVKIALQKQVEHEFENERLYLSMALWCAHKGYTETSKFFSLHSLEEREHAMDFINSMLKQGYKVETPYTKDIPRDFEDLKDVLVQSIRKEKETSKMIAELHKLAIEEASLASEVTSKYIEEQLEEEQLFLSLLNLYKKCDGSIIDFEMEVCKLRQDPGKYKIGEL